MRFEFPTSRIQVFCKAPVIGSVKTRLIPYLGEHAATRLHERLAKQTIEVCKASRLAPIELWCMPDTEHDFFQQFADDNTSLHVQQGSELGERMFTGIAHALLNERADSVVLIGTDCPTLDSDYLRDALERLGEFDAVVGPAEDGGYCLIGLTVADSSLFANIPWGEATVAARTYKALDAAGHHLSVLSPRWDVDRPEDVKRLESLNPPIIPV